MPTFTAMFTFDAVDLADAEAQIQTWVVTAGAVLQQLSGTVMSDAPPLTAPPEGGVLSQGMQPAVQAEPPTPEPKHTPPLLPDPQELGKLNPGRHPDDPDG